MPIPAMSTTDSANTGSPELSSDQTRPPIPGWVETRTHFRVVPAFRDHPLRPTSPPERTTRKLVGSPALPSSFPT